MSKRSARKIKWPRPLERSVNQLDMVARLLDYPSKKDPCLAICHFGDVLLIANNSTDYTSTKKQLGLLRNFINNPTQETYSRLIAPALSQSLVIYKSFKTEINNLPEREAYYIKELVRKMTVGEIPLENGVNALLTKVRTSAFTTKFNNIAIEMITPVLDTRAFARAVMENNLSSTIVHSIRNGAINYLDEGRGSETSPNHAEGRIMQYIALSTSRSKEQEYDLGISKLCCASCYATRILMLSVANINFTVAGSHGQKYTYWNPVTAFGEATSLEVVLKLIDINKPMRTFPESTSRYVYGVDDIIRVLEHYRDNLSMGVANEPVFRTAGLGRSESSGRQDEKDEKDEKALSPRAGEVATHAAQRDDANTTYRRRVDAERMPEGGWGVIQRAPRGTPHSADAPAATSLAGAAATPPARDVAAIKESSRPVTRIKRPLQTASSTTVVGSTSSSSSSNSSSFSSSGTATASIDEEAERRKKARAEASTSLSSSFSSSSSISSSSDARAASASAQSSVVVAPTAAENNALWSAQDLIIALQKYAGARIKDIVMNHDSLLTRLGEVMAEGRGKYIIPLNVDASTGKLSPGGTARDLSHWVGLYIEKDATKVTKVIYVDPVAVNTIDPSVDMAVRRSLNKLRVEQPLHTQRIGIQHTSVVVGADGPMYHTTNNHCGPFIVKLLSNLSNNGSLGIPMRLFNKEGSDAWGKELRDEMSSALIGIRSAGREGDAAGAGVRDSSLTMSSSSSSRSESMTSGKEMSQASLAPVAPSPSSSSSSRSTGSTPDTARLSSSSNASEASPSQNLDSAPSSSTTTAMNAAFTTLGATQASSSMVTSMSSSNSNSSASVSVPTILDSLAPLRDMATRRQISPTLAQTAQAIGQTISNPASAIASPASATAPIPTAAKKLSDQKVGRGA